MTGGWDGFRRGDIDEGPPPSNDPQRPPKGAASVSNPKRVQATCYRCCGNHEGCTAPTEEQK